MGGESQHSAYPLSHQNRKVHTAHALNLALLTMAVYSSSVHSQSRVEHACNVNITTLTVCGLFLNSIAFIDHCSRRFKLGIKNYVT